MFFFMTKYIFLQSGPKVTSNDNLKSQRQHVVFDQSILLFFHNFVLLMYQVREISFYKLSKTILQVNQL